MAVPVWESKGADFSASSATPSFTVPLGAANSKIVIVSMFLDTPGVLVTNVPSEFALVPGTPVDANNHHLYKYWKRLTGIDVGTYDFTLNGSVFIEGTAELYNTCISAGDPFDPNPGAAIDNTAGSITPAVQTDSLGADELIIHSGTCWAGGNWTSPNGYSKRVNPLVGLITVSDKPQLSAGSTGLVSATTNTSDKRTAHIIALKGTTVESPVIGDISESLWEMILDG